MCKRLIICLLYDNKGLKARSLGVALMGITGAAKLVLSILVCLTGKHGSNRNVLQLRTLPKESTRLGDQ
jgi:hypothetical protein